MFCSFLSSLFTYVFCHYVKVVKTQYKAQTWIRTAQGGQDEPKGTIKSSREPKTFIFKNLKKTLGFLKVFGYRSLSRKPQEAEEGSQKTPKELQDPRKGTQNWTQKLSNVWQILEPILGPKSKTKTPIKKTHFGDPLPPHLRGPNNAPPKNKREGWKNDHDWNYTLQKKGRDKEPYKASWGAL